MKAVSLSSRMISPSRPSAPTRTMSYIRAPVIPRAMTAGPAILIMDPLIAISLASIRNSAQLHIESDMLFNQSRDIVFAALQLRLRRREGDDDRQVAVAHPAGDLVLGALKQILVGRGEAVVQRHLRPEHGHVDLALKGRGIVEGGAHGDAEHAHRVESLLGRGTIRQLEKGIFRQPATRNEEFQLVFPG